MTSPATMQLERDLSWRGEKGKGKENIWKGRVTKLPPLEETRVFPSLPWWIWGGSKAWLWPPNAGHPIHQMAHSGNLHHNSPGSDPPTRHEGTPYDVLLCPQHLKTHLPWNPWASLREEAPLVFSRDLTGEDPGKSSPCGKRTFCFWIQTVDTWKSTKPLTFFFLFSFGLAGFCFKLSPAFQNSSEEGWNHHLKLCGSHQNGGKKGFWNKPFYTEVVGSGSRQKNPDDSRWWC